MSRGRHEEIRRHHRVLLDQTQSREARDAARDRLRELLDARRSDGSPALKIQLLAAAAILAEPPELAFAV